MLFQSSNRISYNTLMKALFMLSRVMYTKTISKGTYFNSEVIRSTFVVDDKLTFAIHGGKLMEMTRQMVFF